MVKHNHYILLIKKNFGHSICHVGSNLSPLQWKHSVLATGPPGQSQPLLFKLNSLNKLDRLWVPLNCPTLFFPKPAK